MTSKDIKRPDKYLVAEALQADVSIRSVEEEDVRLFRPLEEAQRERESIWGLIQTGNRESLLEAFATNSWTAWDLIAVVAASDDPALAALVPELATTLASLLEDQTLKERTVVRLHLREALARTTRDPRERSEAIDIVLREAATLPENTRAEVLRSVVSSFKPLEVMANLIRFLPVARRHGPGVLQGFLGSIDYLIEHGFAVYDDKPALARECRDTTLSLIADLLLKEDTLDEWVQEKVAGIVRTRAKTLGGALSSVIEELARVSGASVERIALGLWGELLTSPKYAERGWVDPDAAVWFMKRPYSWPWRVYDHISRFLHDPKLRKYRIKAVRLLGECGPTSILDPLPNEVEGLRKFLGRLSKESEDQALRKEAAAALARNRARGEEAVWETRISICAIASEPSAALLPGERIAHFVEPARLPIHPPLTILPSPGETSFVARMDASQEVSLDPTTAPSPDLDFSSHQFTTNSGGDGFSPARSGAAATAIHADRLDLASVSFTTTDPAVQSARMLLVREPGDGLFQLDIFEHGRKVLERVEQRRQPTAEDVQQYLNRLRDFDFRAFSIERKHEVAKHGQPPVRGEWLGCPHL